MYVKPVPVHDNPATSYKKQLVLMTALLGVDLITIKQRATCVVGT